MPPHSPRKLPTEQERTGATCKALREKTGLKVGEMANAVGVSYSYWSNIEAGRKRLTPQLLAKAARVLDVPQAAIAHPELVRGSDAA